MAFHTKLPYLLLFVITQSVQSAPQSDEWKFGGVRQLTGTGLAAEKPSPVNEIADPSLVFRKDGGVEVYGTGNDYLVYRNFASFVKGQDSVRNELKLFGPDQITRYPHGTVWDIMSSTVVNDHGEEIPIISGAIATAPDGIHAASGWEYNQGRRSYVFYQNHGKWVRAVEPIFGKRDTTTWIGHTYGRHILTDGRGKMITDRSGSSMLYYEKVSRVFRGRDDPKDRVRQITEIFGRRFKVVKQVDGYSKLVMQGPEIRLIGIETPANTLLISKDGHLPGKAGGGAMLRADDPAIVREDNSRLIEGPRVTKIVAHGKAFYVMGMSGGDFNSSKYGIHFAVAEKPEGPFHPYFDTSGFLYDFGAEIREKGVGRGPLSWGPARPYLFDGPDDNTWLIFHAVEKNHRPYDDYAHPTWNLGEHHRNLYVVPVRKSIDEKGFLRLELAHGFGKFPRESGPAGLGAETPATSPSANSAEGTPLSP